MNDLVMNAKVENRNLLKDKSFAFAVRTIRLYKHLKDSKMEYVLSKQLLRSGTSIGALIREAKNAESKMDFIHKLSIAQKECDETLYWIELLSKTSYLNEAESNSIHNEALALLKIIKSSVITAKQSLKK